MPTSDSGVVGEWPSASTHVVVGGPVRIPDGGERDA